MSQVNINAGPPSSPPPRRPSRWPIYVFLAILAVLLVSLLAVAALRNNNQQAAANPTPTPTTASSSAAASATAAAASGAATATPGGSGATATPQAPTNPTAMRVTSGTCGNNRITWTWSGAQRATAYDVVVYSPRSGATIRNVRTSGTSYNLGASPGTAVALKVRSRNSAGTGSNYFTPNSVGHVPSLTSNPTQVTSSVTGHTITFFWTGAQHASAYDFVLYHYSGGVAKDDIKGRVTVAHWGTAVTPGVTYHLKVRSVGECGPSTFFTPSTSAVAGATPTP